MSERPAIIGARRVCSACHTAFGGLGTDNLCLNCDSDQALYQATRKKGDKRKFLPYPQLLDEWKKRRAECKELRKLIAQANETIHRTLQLERENATLRLAVERSATELASEILRLRADLQTQRARADYYQKLVADEMDAHITRFFEGIQSPMQEQ